MTVKELMNKHIFEVINEGGQLEREITTPFCCDLLSIAMSKAPAGSAWVTVMANINTLAVAVLADASCIILAEGVSLDEASVAKAKEQEITVFSSQEPIYVTAKQIDLLL